jgi:ribosome-associated protein
VEAVFDVESSQTLSKTQRERLSSRLGPVVRAVAQDERSQSRNRELALERLAQAIRAGLRVPRKRRPTKPTAAARERRLEAKKRRGTTKKLRRPPKDAG